MKKILHISMRSSRLYKINTKALIKQQMEAMHPQNKNKKNNFKNIDIMNEISDDDILLDRIYMKHIRYRPKDLYTLVLNKCMRKVL